MLERYCIMMFWPASNTPTRVKTTKISAPRHHHRARKPPCGGRENSDCTCPNRAGALRVIKLRAQREEELPRILPPISVAKQPCWDEMDQIRDETAFKRDDFTPLAASPNLPNSRSSLMAQAIDAVN